jgi:breast cancer 2 susceptibility protein
MLSRITPDTAQWYRFYDQLPDAIRNGPPEDDPQSKVILGPEEALRELRNRGCRLVTAAWVENHWGLVLWKLAAMVALEPKKEIDGRKQRWCWREVIRQLLYR